MMQSNNSFNLEFLHKRHSGVTAALAAVFYEAVCVCLNRHHNSPVEVTIQTDKIISKRLADFQKPTPTALKAWANEIDTTETGAYGICLAAIEADERLVAVGRAETLTGADWYVAPIGTSPDDLEQCLRLEVSGIDAGNHAAIKSRLLQKVSQARKGASNLPALASVVGFKERQIAIERVK